MPASTRRPAPKIYCAGPLFNEYEREQMAAIADALVVDGYRVYLPHRDGMEFRLVLDVLVDRGWAPPTAAAFLHQAIFALDVYQLAADCDAVACCLNGRTPDEGTVSLAAIAWALGKPLVAFKDDVRTLLAGRDNPMVVGPFGFVTVDTEAALVEELGEALEASSTPPVPVERMPPKLRRVVASGRRLWDALGNRDAVGNDDLIADVVEELFAPPEELDEDESAGTADAATVEIADHDDD